MHLRCGLSRRRRTGLSAVRAAAVAGGLAGALSTLLGCGADVRNVPTAGSPSLTVFNAAGEDLTAYDPNDGFRKQVLVSGGEDEHAGGLSLNGQICFDPAGTGLLVVGDDAGQPQVTPGWAVLQLHGTHVGDFSVTRAGRLVPTYQHAPDNFGCGFLSGGRALTTDIGDSRSGAGNGQLIVWFPPLNASSPHYCKLDIAIGTAGGIYVDRDEHIYVASARVDPGVYRYTGPFPTADTAAGGCGGHDGTGAPMVEHLTRERFITADAHARTPSAIVASGHGTFYVSSVLNGVIAEYDASGKLVLRILQPPAGEMLGPTPFSTGSPFGIGIDASGTVYYADLGLIAVGLDIGPGDHTGTVRRIRFANGEPLAPETMEANLAFPDGIGVVER